MFDLIDVTLDKLSETRYSGDCSPNDSCSPDTSCSPDYSTCGPDYGDCLPD